MNEQRLIDANALDDALAQVQTSLESNEDQVWERNRGHHKGLATARAIVREAPAIDAVPVVHARWEPIDGTGDGIYKLWRCSACKNGATAGDETGPDIPYCFCCGAKMDGGAVDGI